MQTDGVLIRPAPERRLFLVFRGKLGGHWFLSIPATWRVWKIALVELKGVLKRVQQVLDIGSSSRFRVRQDAYKHQTSDASNGSRSPCQITGVSAIFY